MEVKNQDMNRNIKVLALISIVIAAAIGASLVFALQPTVKADSTTGSLASDVSLPALSSVNSTDNNTEPSNIFMGFDGPRGMFEPRGRGGFGNEGFGVFQLSSDFTTNVTNIAKNDSDFQNLLNQGYNITSIRPVITTTIDGNGTLTTKATTADLTLKSTNGRAYVVVDLAQAKVTKIVTYTRTEIDK
jgi:hypothetical protein